jgi:flagellar protein FliS
MNPYFEQMILSASPVGLVNLLYQGAIASVSDAREHLRAGRIAERAQAIAKSYAILAELMASLDSEKAPVLAGNLHRLYAYMQGRVVEANLQQTDAPLAETLRLLITLADSWSETAGMSSVTGSGVKRAARGYDDGEFDDCTEAACAAVFA